uniref:Uncharacterized protein n=1 Tax=Globodera rostochiensis TaxID=31243 RepID=A0A914HPM1_GLORO
MSCPKRISEQSALAFNSALNVFAVPPTNVSVSRSFFRELLPLSTISQEGPYLFRMFNDSLWADLSRVYLYLELSIKKPNAHGVDVPIDAADDADVGPCQSIGQTFVQQLKVEVQNTELYDSGTLYPYKAYITNELSFPDNVKRNFMASSGYYPSLTHDDRNDTGFRQRCSRFAGGRKAQFFSRLDFDLGNQELYLLSNMDILFTIYRARNSFLLQCLAQNVAAGRQYSLFVHDIKLYVKMVEVQPSLNMSIYKTLEKQPATYAVRRTEVKSCFLTAGRTELDHAVFSAAIPRRITIALVINRAFNGAYALSPFDFRPYNIRDISVHAGGNVYPAVPHRMNFKGADYVRPFVDMYEALGMANSERSMDISLEQFRDGWTFFVVPMTSTLDDSCGFELLRSGTTSVRLQFNEEVPPGGVEMICLANESFPAPMQTLLTLDRPEPDAWRDTPTLQRTLHALVLLLHYSVVLPLFALCCLILLRWMRKRGLLVDRRRNPPNSASSGNSPPKPDTGAGNRHHQIPSPVAPNAPSTPHNKDDDDDAAEDRADVELVRGATAAAASYILPRIIFLNKMDGSKA